MQFALSTTKEALISPLNFVAGAADYRGTVPMLGTALLKTTGGRLSLLCSDGAVLARTLAECKVDHEGELAVDARRFGDLIKAMPDKQAISLAMDGEQLLVKAGRSRFRLPVHSAEDYPKMVTSDEGKVTIQISSKRLGEMFEEVSAAMASADVRHFLNVTCLTLMEGALWTVATDGHRMIVSCQPIEGSEKIPATEVLVPRKSALLARKLLATSTEDATLVFGKGEFRIQFKDGTVLLSKCVDGKYPDWKRVIPETPCVATIEKEKLRNALGMVRASIESSNKKGPAQRAVRLLFGKSLVAVSHADVATSELEADNPDSSNEEIGVSVDYITDAVEAMPKGGKDIRVGYEGSTKPLTVRPVGADYPLSIVMPLRD